jgi:starch-binding outer membrane protein, SusD/RagB family
MKKIIILLSAILVMTISAILNSCNKDILEITNPDITESDYFKTEDDFFRGIIGAYAKITDLYWFNNNAALHGSWLLPGDDITVGAEGGHDGNYGFDQFVQITPSKGAISDIWSTLYQIINRATIVMIKCDEGDAAIFTDPTMKDKIKGEAMFLRAWCYYKLWNTWGTAPLITTRITDFGSIKTPNSKDSELLDQAITDLTEAASLLPETWPPAQSGRVFKGSAYGMLGKCLVFRACWNKKTDAAKSAEDYTAAIAAFNNVTTRTLTPNFGDNFDATKENNEESLFEFQASSQAGFENIWLANDFNQAIGAMDNYLGYYTQQWQWWNQCPYVPSKKLIAAFEPGDPRIAETFDTTSNVNYYGYIWQKYIKHDIEGGFNTSMNNPRILRYADILLLKAEAILNSGGNKAEAIGLINEIRTRARGAGTVPADLSTAESDDATIMQWIMDERLRELCGDDDHRWFDLKRWHYAGYIDLSTWDGGDGVTGFSCSRPAGEFKFSDFLTATEGKLWYPIPSSEINSNSLVMQNPGY